MRICHIGWGVFHTNITDRGDFPEAEISALAGVGNRVPARESITKPRVALDGILGRRPHEIIGGVSHFASSFGGILASTVGGSGVPAAVQVQILKYGTAVRNFYVRTYVAREATHSSIVIAVAWGGGGEQSTPALFCCCHYQPDQPD